MVYKTTYEDDFAAVNLPASEEMPDFLLEKSEFQYPEYLNAAVFLLARQLKRGNGAKCALQTLDDQWCYQDLENKSNQLAHVLRIDMDVKTGSRILLRSPNNPMMMICWLAVLKVGAIAVSTMPLLRAADLVPILDKAEIEFSLCDDRLEAEIFAAQKQTSKLQKIMLFGDLEKLMQKQDITFAAHEPYADDVALIAFTSGTTGKPKGCMHYHRDIISMCVSVGDKLLGLNENDVIIGSPPLAFTFGLGALLCFPLYAGASTVVLEKPAPEIYLKAIQTFGVTWSFTAPTAYRAMLPLVKNYDLSSLKGCFSAGEGLPRATFDAWKEAVGISMTDGIGTTELIHVFISATGENICAGATGQPLYGYEAKIFDDQMKEAPQGQVGFLAVRGPVGCKYLCDDRQADYVKQGWNFTGDAYLKDEDGYFHFQARADDMIITSGYNVSGPEVENCLLDHPAIAEAAVIGVANEERGEIIKAFIILEKGAPLKEEMDQSGLVKEIQDFVKANIAPYKYPRQIEFLDRLPKTETGKIQRFKLK
jgi:2-aminobenzoate-CoA ligase